MKCCKEEKNCMVHSSSAKAGARLQKISPSMSLCHHLPRQYGYIPPPLQPLTPPVLWAVRPQVTSNGQGLVFVCVSVSSCMTWRMEQWSWFPRSLSALFCTNIWKYFISIYSELSPQAACLTFCISVAVRVVKRRENEMQSNSGSWIKLWKSVYIESYLKYEWVHRAFLSYFDQRRCSYFHITRDAAMPTPRAT